MWKSKIFKSRTVRASAQSAMAAPASAPDSQVASAKNSQASSAAVAELTAGLDFVFDQLDGAEDPGDMLRLHLERLNEEASKYQTSRVGEGVGQEWTCSPGMCQLLQAACQCSSLVYDQKQLPDVEGIHLEPLMHRTPSMTGTVKAASMWKIADVPVPGWSGKTLVVSIRGTASGADHMVNMNGAPRDASSFLKFDDMKTNVSAHTGFLTCAQTLLPTLRQELVRHVGIDGKISNILFTGHSAGGAVSSLAFLHLASRPPSELSSAKFSLITFGSAPAVSANVTEICKGWSNVGLTLAFANEYDMVSRADGPYLRSIVDLYRSRYGLAPVSGDSGVMLDQEKPVVSSLAVHASIREKGAWPLPSPLYHLVGDIVVLRTWLGSTDTTDDSSSVATAIAPLSVRAVSVSGDEFSRLLFCDITVHRRRVYLARLDMLARDVSGDAVSLDGDTQYAGTENWSQEDLTVVETTTIGT